MRPQYFRPKKPRASRNLRLFRGLIILLLASSNAFAQIQQAWVARYNNGLTNGTNQAVKMALDSNGNILVVGVSQNTNNELGYVALKYAPNGTQLWAARYDSTNHPAATPSSMAIDGSNNVVVTGNALTVKYNSNGIQQWTAPYAGSSLAVDANRNVAITGFGGDFNTVELDPEGGSLWQQTYPSSCGSVLGQAVVIDTNSNVYVVGTYSAACEEGLVDYELLAIKYSSSGALTWAANNGELEQAWQTVGAMFDASANLYVSGNYVSPPEEGYIVFKFNFNGDLAWSEYPGSPGNNGHSQSHCAVLELNDQVVMTGQIPTSFVDDNPLYSYGTIAIGTNGSTLWTSVYPASAAATSVANAIAVDQANNAYVTGYSPGLNGTNNIVTIKYGPNGNQLWLQTYNGFNAGNNAGNAIVVDKNGNVYVTGYETLTGGGTGIVTIKYIPISIQRQTNGTVLIETQGTPGESFDIQASSDLLNWLDLGTILADTNGLMQFDDTNAPTYPARFYYTNPK